MEYLRTNGTELLRGGRIPDAFLSGKTWNIPEDAVRPMRMNHKSDTPKNLLEFLCAEKSARVKSGIYHKVQIELTYNSNHMEGSRLTHDQTRYIYETNTIGAESAPINVDDIVETANHFRCIDMIIEHANRPLSETLIKKLLDSYNTVGTKTLEELAAFHFEFEAIHPFQDGSGRVGRLILFKEWLRNNIVPFMIDDNLKLFYYRRLHEWKSERRYFIDTFLAAQDQFKAYLDYFRVQYDI